MSDATKEILHILLEEIGASAERATKPFAALARFGFRYAALDWFREQIDEPEKRELRGLRSGELLPQSLGLLGEIGLPLPAHPRAAWERLANWLDDDEAILAFSFAEGVPPRDRELLEADLAQLWKQPWSPRAGVGALLRDWPSTVVERSYTLEAADRELRAACEEELSKLKAKKSGRKDLQPKQR